MKNNRLFSLLSAAVLSFSLGNLGPVYADDTEIYLNSASSTGSANILFNLDTSGSMGSKVDENNNGVIDSGERTRIEVLKVAMDAVLNSLPALNAGIMRYHYYGGPILYPIAPLNALACEIEGNCVAGSSPTGTQTVTTLLSDSNDDAEQEGALTVVLDRPALDIGQRPAGTCGNFSGAIQVSDPADDAESRISTGSTSTTSTDLELPRDGSRQQVTGIRFQTVPIPKGATVTNARLVFEVDSNTRSGYNAPIDMLIQGENVNGPRNAFAGGDGPIDRLAANPTAATVDWETGEFPDVNDSFTSPNVSAIVNELVNSATWPVAGGDMVFLIYQDPAAAASASGSRELESHNGESSAAPVLTFDYQFCGAATPTEVRTGLRFSNVSIPQGATITSARIDLVSSTGNTADPGLRIKMENVDDAAPFAVGSPFSSRSYLASTVAWDAASTPPLDDPWVVDTTYSTPDLTGLVQSVVNRTGWCGGNDMVFMLERNAASTAALRTAYASEGDSTKAPVLTLTYDADSPQPGANGCIVSTVISTISATNNDAEEAADGSMNLDSSDLEMVEDSSTQKIGLRFDDIPIAQGSVITAAKLVFTVDEINSGITSIDVKGQLSTNAQPFSTSVNNISDTAARPRTSASVTWSPPSFSTIGQVVELPGLESVVQEVVNQGGWTAGNALAFLIEGSGKRVAQSYDLSPATAPRLQITFQGTPSSSQKTVRTRLQEVVANLKQRGGTPIAGSMLEAAYYFRGDDVRFGRQRGDQSSSDAVTNVSHPASYAANGATVTFPGSCSESNQEDTDCKTQVISGGSPKYKSPIIAECQANYLVNLTDGGGYYTGDGKTNTLGQSIDEKALINAMTAKDSLGNPVSMPSCATDTTLPDGTTYSGSDHNECTVKLAQFLHDNDLIYSATQTLNTGTAPINGTQTLDIFTIGFNLCGTGNVTSLDGAGEQVCCTVANHNSGTGICSSPIADPDKIKVLKAQAAVAGGKYFNANTVDELVAAFTDITTSILEKSTSFVAPSIAANAFNRLFSRDEVYFGLFEPSRQARWDGNVKKYSICIDTDPDNDGTDDCVLGDVLDVDGDPAIVNVAGATDDGLFDTNAQSIWSVGIDGRDTKLGGAGSVITDYETDRLIYTEVNAIDGQALNNQGLSASGYNVDFSNWNNGANSLVRDQVCPNPADITPNSDCENRMLWMLGKDAQGEDNPLSANTRWWFHDVLHSSPVSVTYGQDAAGNFIDKILVGTNDGALHFINGTSGKEEWAFIPNAALPDQQGFYNNTATTHAYGLDSTPVIGVSDVNLDGTIDPATDFIGVVITQRRGGNNMYALNISPDVAALDDVTDLVEPKFLWHITNGGVGTDFARLGQTWSEPVISTISTPAGPHTVIIFGGGYDPDLDLDDGSGIAKNFGTEGGDPNDGNAIYVVDANTGAQIFSISGTGSGADIIIPEMKYAIPSNVNVFDSDGDGLDDRLYVGDSAGQVWRVDLTNVNPASAASPEGDTVVGRLANISTAGTLAKERRFFYKPTVVQVIDTEFSNAANGEFDYVLIGSGNRANPLDSEVEDRFYAFRDVNIGPMVDANNDNIADVYPLQIDATSNSSPILDNGLGDLIDITSDTLDGADPDHRNALGWYYDFKLAGRDGEKVLAASSVFGGTLIFTSYIPDDPAAINDICSAAEGSGRAYNMNILSTSAAIDWDEDGAIEPIIDRSAQLGTGIPSEGVPIFTKEGVTVLVGTGGGAENIGKVSELPRYNTYWYEEQ